MNSIYLLLASVLFSLSASAASSVEILCNSESASVSGALYLKSLRPGHDSVRGSLGILGDSVEMTGEMHSVSGGSSTTFENFVLSSKKKSKKVNLEMRFIGGRKDTNSRLYLGRSKYQLECSRKFLIIN